jgi:SAM-dependent methyltransferase
VTKQRDTFAAGEGDAWFLRNADVTESVVDDRIASHVAPGGDVLEIGCSDGRRLASLASSTGRRVGVDPSAAAIGVGRDRWPELELHVGSADALPVDGPFDVVVFGFCLYLCDRELLPRIVAEGDRVLRDGGTLAIVDFDPPFPTRRAYRHRDGLWSWKMDYASLYAAFPSYVVAEKVPLHHDAPAWTADERERVALTILKKHVDGGYAEEADS